MIFTPKSAASTSEELPLLRKMSTLGKPPPPDCGRLRWTVSKQIERSRNTVESNLLQHIHRRGKWGSREGGRPPWRHFGPPWTTFAPPQTFILG